MWLAPVITMDFLVSHPTLAFDLPSRPSASRLRRVKQLANAVLKELSAVFDSMYSTTGRPSIPPERLLKGSLLMALYTARSEHLFCEQLYYNLLFRWFLDMELDEASFDHSSFSANRARLLEHEVAGEFFRGVVEQVRALKLLLDEHFTVDGENFTYGLMRGRWRRAGGLLDRDTRPKGEKRSGVAGPHPVPRHCSTLQLRNVLDHLPKHLKPQPGSVMRGAFRLGADEGIARNQEGDTLCTLWR
jgi:transposase